MIRIGTSGFSYDDWVGIVYPDGLPQRDWLSFYAREFSTLELNVTYYRIPAERTVESWVKRTPDDFLFSVKAFQDLTHGREAPDFQPFVLSLRPMLAAGKLGCVLAQFPQSFHPTLENRDYLKRLREGMGDIATVVEFRHIGWFNDETFDLLRSLNFGFCAVDEPRLPGLMPPVAAATGPVAYVRFHGRNAAKWYAHEEAWQRYDYTYKPAELREWAPKIRQLNEEAPLTLVFFNNHYRGQSIKAAHDLQPMLLDT
jgi:uncharacterized protein YecE (DUF72 family)